MLGSAAEGPRLPHPNVEPPWVGNTRLGAVRSPLGSLLGEGLCQRFCGSCSNPCSAPRPCPGWEAGLAVQRSKSPHCCALSFPTRPCQSPLPALRPRSWVFPGLLQPLGGRGCPPQQGTIPVTAEDPFLLLPSRCHSVPVPTVSPLPRCPCCHGVPVPMAPVSGRGCFCAAGGNKAGSVTWLRSSAVPGSGRGRGEQLSDPKSSPSRGLTRVLHWEGEFIWPRAGGSGRGSPAQPPMDGGFWGGTPRGPLGGGAWQGPSPVDATQQLPAPACPCHPRQ